MFALGTVFVISSLTLNSPFSSLLERAYRTLGQPVLANVEFPVNRLQAHFSALDEGSELSMRTRAPGTETDELAENVCGRNPNYNNPSCLRRGARPSRTGAHR